MKPTEIRVGYTYRALSPVPLPKGEFKDRRVEWILNGWVGYLIPAIPLQLNPSIKLESFARWADRCIDGGGS